MSQVHAKFKLFTKKFTSEQSLNDLFGEIEKWVKDSKVGPKSVGIEYLESSKTIIMSIGYADNESYSVKLKSNLIGKVDLISDFKSAEESMVKASSKFNNIICHELFITESGDFYMVFMTKE